MRIGRGAPLLLVAALLLGCGDDDEGVSSATLVAEDDDPTTTTAEPTTTTADDPDVELKAEIEDAYYAQWDAYVEILSDPDPTNPLIDRHFAGAARERLLDAISADIREGLVTRRPASSEHFRHVVETVDVRSESEAVVVSCVIDGLVVQKRSSGEIVNDTVAVLRVESAFVLDGSLWKLDDSVRLERFEQGNECA